MPFGCPIAIGTGVEKVRTDDAGALDRCWTHLDVRVRHFSDMV